MVSLLRRPHHLVEIVDKAKLNRFRAIDLLLFTRQLHIVTKKRLIRLKLTISDQMFYY
jgi:hypothetical protein